METVEYEFASPDSGKKGSFKRLLEVILNLLTLFILFTTLCIAVYFSVIFLNPYSSLNLFPPPTLPPKPELPTATPTSRVVLPPTWTPTETLIPSPTNTSRATATLPPTATSFSLPELSATPTFTPTPFVYRFALREGSPTAIPNLYHPELGCNWMGVGGQAVDMSGAPLIGLIVRIGGILPGVTLPDPLMSLTGVALNYGRAGYEFTLADRPIASLGSLWIQLLDQSGVPLSEQIFFETHDSCDKNLIIIDFIQTREY